MKTNQIFNFKRFGKYTYGTFLQRYRQLLLMAGVLVAAIFLMLFFVINISNHGRMNSNQWNVFFYLTSIVAGLLFIGSAFPALRKKERTVTFLMVPASAIEKFLYEFMEKLVLFFLLFPLLFYVVGNLAAESVQTFRDLQGATSHVVPFTFEIIQKKSPDNRIEIILALGAVFYSLAFAGATAFRKYPLVKTITVVGSVAALVAWYIYLLIDKMKLRHPWVEYLGDHWSKQQGFIFLTSILLLVSFIALAFAYFKLKEKEVS